jgi:hypothetical protein
LREDEVFPTVAAIDIGASSHRVAGPPKLAQATADEPVRDAGAMTDDLTALARRLVKLGVDTVALASTGVYWIPVFEVLEQHLRSGGGLGGRGRQLRIRHGPCGQQVHACSACPGSG